MIKRAIFHSLLALLLSAACGANAQDTYTVSGSQILKNGIVYEWRGANAMHTFGGNSDQMKTWNIDICREFIGNLRDTPIAGSAVYAGGSWLHPLQTIVDRNRANGMVTILCPFYWDGTSGTDFIGKTPSQTWWWDSYKERYRAIANQFRNQPDVWFDLWNEPFAWDRSSGYSDDLWLQEMQAMVDNIRSTGVQNIIVVPGAEAGQDDDVLLAKGQALLQGRSNLVFGIHAYTKWMGDAQSVIETRIQSLQNIGLPVIFTEYGHLYGLYDHTAFLGAVRNKRISSLAWLWKYNTDDDPNALLTADGTAPNDANSGGRGSMVQAYCLEARNLAVSPESGSGLTGSYFSNMTLADPPALNRLDPNINFRWSGGTAPAPSLPGDRFSVRWQGWIKPKVSQSHTFYTQTDDGVRLWINGALLVNNWTNHSWQENNGTIPLEAGRLYPIQLEFYENTGDATCKLLWAAASVPKEIVPETSLYPQGSGLTASYFDNSDLTALKTTRIDAFVDNNWAGSYPAGTGITNSDTWSARWTGSIMPKYSQAYTIYTRSDDGVRLWIDGALIINNWTAHSETENSAVVVLAAGRRHAIKMEYYENGGNAVARLLWSSPNEPKAAIPQSNLLP